MIPFNSQSFIINVSVGSIHQPLKGPLSGNPADWLKPPQPTTPEHKHPAAALEHQERQRCIERIEQHLAHSDMPGQQHIKAFVQHKYRQQCKAGTIQSYYMTIKSFMGFMQQHGTPQLSCCTPQDIEAFIEYQQDCGVAITTVRLWLTNLTAFFRFLIAEGIVDAQVLAHRIRLRMPEVLPRAIDSENLRQLIGAITPVRDRALILLLLRTGMRVGELLNTRVQDIILPEKKILIYESRKTGIGRVVYFSEDARQALQQWLQQRDVTRQFLFYSNRNPRLSYSAARSIFVKYLTKADLTGRGYGLHRLRHSFASELLNAGMRLECLQPLLGHTRIEMTRRYARLTDKSREEEYFRAMAIIERGQIHGRLLIQSSPTGGISSGETVQPTRSETT